MRSSGKQQAMRDGGAPLLRTTLGSGTTNSCATDQSFQFPRRACLTRTAVSHKHHYNVVS